VCEVRLKFSHLFKLRVLGFRGGEDGDVGVAVLPQGQEILVGGAGFGRVALHGVDACDLQVS
jgi:hypothetical protein